MLNRVVEGFLHNAVGSQLEVWRQAMHRTGDSQPDGEAFSLICLARQHLQRRDEAQVLQVDWAQIAAEAANSLDRVYQHTLHSRQALRSQTWVGRQKLLSHLHPLAERDQCLGRVIVQFPRQAPSLLFLPLGNGGDIVMHALLIALDPLGHLVQGAAQILNLFHTANRRARGTEITPRHSLSLLA